MEGVEVVVLREVIGRVETVVERLVQRRECLVLLARHRVAAGLVVVRGADPVTPVDRGLVGLDAQGVLLGPEELEADIEEGLAALRIAGHDALIARRDGPRLAGELAVAVLAGFLLELRPAGIRVQAVEVVVVEVVADVEAFVHRLLQVLEGEVVLAEQRVAAGDVVGGGVLVVAGLDRFLEGLDGGLVVAVVVELHALLVPVVAVPRLRVLLVLGRLDESLDLPGRGGGRRPDRGDGFGRLGFGARGPAWLRFPFQAPWPLPTRPTRRRWPGGTPRARKQAWPTWKGTRASRSA